MAERLQGTLFPAKTGRRLGGTLFFGLFAVLAVMACAKYLALHTTVFDLGVFLSNLFAVFEGGEWWRAFLGHAQPLMLVYAFIYRLVPTQAAPLLLLALQALALALPAWFVGRRYGVLAALAYALYFPVWTNALFDFHLDHLLFPILLGFLMLAASGRYRLAAALAVLAALVKEPYALTTAFCGLYLFAVHGRRLAGMALILFGGLYFYAATAWLIPFCTADAGIGLGGGAFAWLGGSLSAVAGTLFLHPVTVLSRVFLDPGKLKYLGICFGALLFLPLFRPKHLLPAVPALAISLLSALPSYYGYVNHYSAGLAGPLFFAFAEVLAPLRILAGQLGVGSRRIAAAIFLACLLGHILVAPSPISRLFLTGDNFAFHYTAYQPSSRDAGILKDILDNVPADPSLAVISQNTLNWGALAERFDYNSFPLAVFTPHPVRDLSGATAKDFVHFVRTGENAAPVRTWQAEYVLLDLTRPWFVLDRGCEFFGGSCRDPAVAQEFVNLVARARSAMDVVVERDGFLVLKRRPPPPPPQPEPEEQQPEPQAPQSREGDGAPTS